MKDSEYFKIDLHSNSRLSNFDKKGARAINSKFGGDTEELNLGALVEELLQGDNNSLKENFIITDNVKPTAFLGDLTTAMIENNAKHNIETAVTLAKMLGLWSNVVNHDVYRKKIDKQQFWEYLRLQKTKKRIVSPEMYTIAKTMKNGLVEGMFTKDIYNVKKGEELIDQQVIIWNKKTCKSKLDTIKVNHKLKTLTPYDLKTTSFNKETFISSFYKFRYYIQASMYHDAIIEWAFINFPDYKVKPFQFIVVQKDDPNNPLVYTVSDVKISEGRDGFFNEDGKLLRKGYKQLIEEYDWHVNMNMFDFSMETYKADGNILIE